MMFDRILELCAEKNVKLNSVIKSIGVATGSATAWKNGSYPRSDIIAELAQYFGVSTDYLLGLTDYRNMEEYARLSKLREFATDDLSIDIFRQLTECMLKYKDFYEEQCGYSDEQEPPELCKAIHTNLSELIKMYSEIPDTIDVTDYDNLFKHVKTVMQSHEYTTDFLYALKNLYIKSDK